MDDIRLDSNRHDDIYRIKPPYTGESVRRKRRHKMAGHMVVFECLFETFDARGDDEYLDIFSERLDGLFASGWKLAESRRDTAFSGWWRVELLRPSVSEMQWTSPVPER
jgi:hypothetical protein